MSRARNSWIIGVLAAALCGAVWAQDSGADPGQAAATKQEPVAAYGQPNASPVSDNPPLSGIDQPTLEPHSAPLSYLQAGATASESADSNVENGLGGGSFRSVSRGIGSLTLQRLWSHYDLGLQYEGGAGYYNLRGIGWKLLQQLDAQQKISWKRGQLAFRDSFSYLPEGNFGSAYGSLGSLGISSLGSTSFGSFVGGTSLGTLGIVPRITNVSLVDMNESLTPRSTVTAAAGYALTHFYGSDPLSGIQYLNNRQLSGQVGYNHLISAHSQLALVYGYQGFDFDSVGTSFHTNVVEVMFGHRISGRMDFMIGAGPQFTNIGLPCSFIDILEGNPHCQTDSSGNISGQKPDFRVGVAAMSRFRYHFTKTMLEASFQRVETSGSGFFAGAQSDIARLKVERPLTRVWSGFSDLGYVRNSRLQPLTAQQQGTCGGANQPACPGLNANIYNYGFVGVGVHRTFGHDFHGFASYQFNELSFDNSYCAANLPCQRIGHRHVISLGLDWTPRPIRID